MLGKLKLLLTVLTIPIFVATSMPVYATTFSTSPNYSVDQVLFGAGGDSNTGYESSPNYESQVALGETGVGNFTSSNYQAYAGFTTTNTPYLQAVVTSSNLNLGVMSTLSTATATGTFFVRAWDAQGYTVQTESAGPTNSTYVMHSPSTPTAPAVGTEQFGMNLVADTTPTSLPTDSPASANVVQTTTYCCTISYGAPTANYATANKYAYNNGDTIAQSTQSTSSTIYTISYIFNIAGTTPGGTYVFNQNLVVTGTY
jgi:hypothetical protein